MFNWFKRKERRYDNDARAKLEAMLNKGLGQLLDSETALGLLYQQEVQETLSRALKLGLERVSWRPDVYSHLAKTPRLVQFDTAELFAPEKHSSRMATPPASLAKQTSSRRMATPPSKPVSMAPGRTYRPSERPNRTGTETSEGSLETDIWECPGCPNCPYQDSRRARRQNP